MARITVEDCLENIDISRFDLTVLAADRARQIAMGSRPLVERNGDKETVIALREISEGLITRDIYDQIEMSLMMVDRPTEESSDADL